MSRPIRVGGSFSVSIGQYVPQLGHPVVVLVDVSGDPAVHGGHRHEAFAFFTEGDDFYGHRFRAPRETVEALGNDPVPDLALSSSEAALRHVMLGMYRADRDPAYLRPLEMVEQRASLATLWLSGRRRDVLMRIHSLTDAQVLIDHLAWLRTLPGEIVSTNLA